MVNFYVCVPYFSMPEFPESCKFVRNNVVPRDILLCNKTNDYHKEQGLQYDPNIENGEYRLCQPTVRRSLEKRTHDYDELLLLFRTRYLPIDGSKKYLVTGFFNVKKEFDREEREGPIIYAKRMRFVSIPDAIDITELMLEQKPFRSGFTSRNQSWEDILYDWYQQLKTTRNRTTAYVREINKLKEIFRANEYDTYPYADCGNCEFVNEQRPICPLIWRQRRRTLTRFSAHYAESLDKYYDSLR